MPESQVIPGFVISSLSTSKKKAEPDSFTPILNVTGEFQAPKDVDLSAIFEAQKSKTNIHLDGVEVFVHISKFGSGSEGRIKATLVLTDPEDADVRAVWRLFDTGAISDVYAMPTLLPAEFQAEPVASPTEEWVLPQ